MKPVCLPERGSTFTGKNATVTGWGAIEESGPLSSTLQEVLVPIMSNNECRTTKYPPKRITDNMLCAGYIDGGKDSCQVILVFFCNTGSSNFINFMVICFLGR